MKIAKTGKIIISMTAFALAFGSVFAAADKPAAPAKQPAAKKPAPKPAAPTTYFVVSGKSNLEILEKPEGAQLKFREWGPESERKFSVRAFCPISREKWTRVSIKLKAVEGGEFALSFGGDMTSDKLGKPKIAAYYDNLKVNGKLLPNSDFEDLKSREWRGYPPRSRIVAAAPADAQLCGKYRLRAVSNYGASSKIFLEKGGVYEFSFDALAMKDSELVSYDDVVDIRKFANMGFVDETAGDGIGGWTDEGSKNSLKKFGRKNAANGVFEYETLRFKILDPEKNSGNAVMTFSSPNSPTGLKEAFIDIPQNAAYGDVLYILHTVSKPKGCKTDNVGYVNVEYTDGARQSMRVVFGSNVGDCWKPVAGGRNMKLAYLNSKKKNRGAFYISRIVLNREKDLKRIEFKSSCSMAWTVVGAVLSGSRVMTTLTTTPEGNPDWVAADMPEDMSVIKGSALDLSSFLPAEPAGAKGRVIVSPRGTMAFADEPEKDVRFKGFSFYPRNFFVKDDDAATREVAKKYAELVKRNGYNLVRMAFDHLKSDKIRDLRAANYDMIDFVISELKKNGVYIHQPLAWYDIGTKDYNFFKRNDVKLRVIFGEPEARSMWTETALEQLEHYNPYTKMKWKDDPVFQVFECYNELVICFNKYDECSPETQNLIVKRWREWLAKKFGTIEKFNEASGVDGYAKRAGAPFKSFDAVPHFLGGAYWENFMMDATNEFIDYAVKTVRSTGYKGLIVQYNLGRTPNMAYSRGKFSDSIITNSYYEHPNGIYTPGADHTCGQASSLASSAGYWRTIATSKFSDRPITATEYNHAYWNKHRFEMMSVFAPYSAYQNFSSLIIHAMSVDWRSEKKKKLSAFNVKESPSIRAAELFNQCFFMRGDVATAKHRVDMKLTKNFIEGNISANRGFGGAQMRIPLLVGFGISSYGAKPDAVKGVSVKPADLEIMPQGSSEIITEGWFQNVVDSNNGAFDIGKFAAELKKRNILPSDNVSDPAAGIYQTDTNQITMDSRKLSMKVATPRSCSITVHESEEISAGALKLVSTSVPATVGVCSLDGRKIGESSRLVFVYATEENNFDAVTSTDGIVSFREGHGPVAMRRGKVSAEIALDPSKKYSVYPIALNGERREKLDFDFADGTMKLSVDNGKLKNGAVSMFEIVAE